MLNGILDGNSVEVEGIPWEINEELSKEILGEIIKGIPGRTLEGFLKCIVREIPKRNRIKIDVEIPGGITKEILGGIAKKNPEIIPKGMSEGISNEILRENSGRFM